MSHREELWPRYVGVGGAAGGGQVHHHPLHLRHQVQEEEHGPGVDRDTLDREVVILMTE